MGPAPQWACMPSPSPTGTVLSLPHILCTPVQDLPIASTLVHNLEPGLAGRIQRGLTGTTMDTPTLAWLGVSHMLYFANCPCLPLAREDF